MKKIFTLLTLCVLFAGCNDDNTDPTGGLVIDESQLTVTLDNGDSSKKIRFTAYEAWTATVTENSASDKWYTLSPISGDAGDMAVQVGGNANTSGNDRSLTILLKAGATEKTITVTQPSQEVFVVPETSYRVGPEGKEIEIEVQSNVEFSCVLTPADQAWIQQTGTKSVDESRAAMTTSTLRFKILPGDTDRIGTIKLVSTNATKEITIIQVYESTDFSADGEVVAMQTATEGNGINIILLGDAFDDKDIAGGFYMETMNKAMEAFFSEEPYATFRSLFNVYTVKLVSKNGSYFTGADTKLKGVLPKKANDVIVSGDDFKCKNYAYKIEGMTAQKLDNTLIIVMMNKELYAGTCYMFPPNSTADYGNGTSIAYFPLGTDPEMFREMLCHESGGHGFPKLGDEYGYEFKGTIPQKEIDDINDSKKDGWYKNNEFTSDPAKVIWSKFIADERYANEHVGVYEGAATYFKGAYRPTENSIMRDNTGGFNAPSREAIYYRIHKLAHGNSWTYDYEKFVEYDAVNRNKAVTAAPRSGAPREFIPLAPPVVRNHPL